METTETNGNVEVNRQFQREGYGVTEVHRGDIFYYNFTGKEVGCEIAGVTDRRPCVVVSNEKTNRFSSVITVVPMTSKQKNPLPARVEYEGERVHGTFLTDQVISISKERLVNYCGTVEADVMAQIDKALGGHLNISTGDSIPTGGGRLLADKRHRTACDESRARSLQETLQRTA